MKRIDFFIHPEFPGERNNDHKEVYLNYQGAIIQRAKEAEYLIHVARDESSDEDISRIIPAERRIIAYDDAHNALTDEFDKLETLCRGGDPFYKEKMINEKGVISGEFSGHMMFSDNYGMDDGLFAVAKVISFLTFSGNKLSELVKPLRVYHQTPEINIRITDISQVDSILKAVEEEFKGENMMYLDGLSVDSVDNREISSGPGQSLGDSGWWFNLRGSNTEPFVRLRIEAKEEGKIDELQARITRTIDSVS